MYCEELLESDKEISFTQKKSFGMLCENEAPLVLVE